MKKMLITLMLITGLFAQSNMTLVGMTLVGGINYSTIAGDDIDDAENLRGFRFGIQKKLENGLIGGVTYSQRGYSISEKNSYYDNYYGDVTEEIKTKFKVNYLTAYVLKPIPMETEIDFFVGGELGYFMSAELKLRASYKDDAEDYTDSETMDFDGDDWDDIDGNKLDYGFVFSGRYTINSQMSIVGTYYFGLAELTDATDAKNRSFQINLAYGL